MSEARAHLIKSMLKLHEAVNKIEQGKATVEQLDECSLLLDQIGFYMDRFLLFPEQPAKQDRE